MPSTPPSSPSRVVAAAVAAPAAASTPPPTVDAAQVQPSLAPASPRPDSAGASDIAQPLSAPASPCTDVVGAPPFAGVEPSSVAPTSSATQGPSPPGASSSSSSPPAPPLPLSSPPAAEAPASSSPVAPAGLLIPSPASASGLLGVRVWASEPDRMRSDLCALANRVSDRVRAPSLTPSFLPCPHGLLFEAALKLLKKSTADPSRLEPLAFLIPELCAAPPSSAGVGVLDTRLSTTQAQLSATQAQLSTAQVQLKAATSARADIAAQLKLVRKRNDSLQDRVAALEQERSSSSTSQRSSGSPSGVSLSKLEELKERVVRLTQERDDALQRARSLEASQARDAERTEKELKKYRDLGSVADFQSALLELQAFRALGTPAEIEERERRLKNLAIFVLRTAIIYDRSLSEYESIAGRVLLGYDRRGRLLESLFHLVAGDSAGIADRLPGVITAVVPDLAAEDERLPDTSRALDTLVSALESSRDPEDGQVLPPRSSLFGLQGLPTADEVRALLRERPDRLQIDFASVPFFEDPDVEAAFAGLVRGGSFSADVIAGLRGRLSSGDQTALDAVVTAETARVPLPGSSTAGVQPVPLASPPVVDVHTASGHSPSPSPSSSPRVGSKNRPLRVASSPDDSAPDDDEQGQRDASDDEVGSHTGGDDEVDEDVRSQGSAGPSDEDDETVRYPHAVPSLGPVTKLLRSELSTVRSSKASFTRSRDDFSAFVQQAIARHAKSDVDGMWPEVSPVYVERSRVLNFPREVSWMLGLFEGEVPTPTTQEYPELVRSAASYQVDTRDLEIFYKTRPWDVLAVPPQPVAFKPDDPRFVRVYSNLKLMYEKHAQVLWERTHYFLPLPDTDERRAFLHLRRKRNSNFTSIWNGHLEAVVELIRDGVSIDVLLDPVFYWPPAYGVLTIIPRKGETIQDAVERVDRLEPERMFFVGESASEHPAYRAREARQLSFQLASLSPPPSPPAAPSPKPKSKSSGKVAARGPSAKSSSSDTAVKTASAKSSSGGPVVKTPSAKSSSSSRPSAASPPASRDSSRAAGKRRASSQPSDASSKRAKTPSSGAKPSSKTPRP